MPLCLEVRVCAHEEAELLDRTAVDAQQMPNRNRPLTMWWWPLPWTRDAARVAAAAGGEESGVSFERSLLNFVAATPTLPPSLPTRLAGGYKADEEADRSEQPDLYIAHQ